MPFYSLPCLTEDAFLNYISGGYSGGYNVVKAFTAQDYQLPMVAIQAGKFKEISPQTDVYEGDLAVSVLTQIDDVADPLATHDLNVGLVYDLMCNQGAVMASVNSGASFHLFGYYNTSYDQSRVDRALVSTLEFKIECQTLALS